MIKVIFIKTHRIDYADVRGFLVRRFLAIIFLRITKQTK
jgi:hypothetical protein